MFTINFGEEGVINDLPPIQEMMRVVHDFILIKKGISVRFKIRLGEKEHLDLTILEHCFKVARKEMYGF